MISLPPFQYSVVVGLLLSDAWLICSSLRSKNSRLGFKQSLAHSEYLWFVFNLLSHYCSSYPHLTTGIRAGIIFYGLEFFTRALPCITELQSLFYIQK
jgi:hypothetical protein